MNHANTSLPDRQREVREYLGPDRVRALQRPIRVLDYGMIIALPALSIAVLAACFLVQSPVALVLLTLAQGAIFQLFGLLNHEFFVHRKVGGRFGHGLSMLFTAPIQLSATRYAGAHWAHHENVVTPEDSEAYKSDIDTRLKRYLFMTAIGTKWAASGKMGVGRAPYFALRRPTARAISRARVEATLSALILVGAVVAAFFAPKAILFGYLLPLLLVLPALNAIRILIEHAEIQPDNPFSIASRFRCGVFEEILFLFDSGEYHLIHHFLPNVPFYRMRAARAALHDFFDNRDVRRTRGWWRLLRSWYLGNRRHGTWWSAQTAPVAKSTIVGGRQG